MARRADVERNIVATDNVSRVPNIVPGFEVERSVVDPAIFRMTQKGDIMGLVAARKEDTETRPRTFVDQFLGY